MENKKILYIFAITMKIRTKEELEAYYAECKKAREQRKLQEREKKRLQALKMKRVKQLQAEREKAAQKAKEEEILEQRRQNLRKPLSIYHSRDWERESTEEDLYLTREELQEAEARMEGEINWINWEKITKNTREMIGKWLTSRRQ